MDTKFNKSQIKLNAVKQFNNVKLTIDYLIVSALSNPIIQSLIH